MSDTTPYQVDAICDLFEKDLLYQTPETDRWAEGGRVKFFERVEYYVRRDLPVMFCLPAFPCKSTNPDKTASVLPDGAEFEALTGLKYFCKNLKTIYPPGCVVDIVSDGHVFSDCIGTDDDLVTQYTSQLHKMTQKVLRSVKFKGVTHRSVVFEDELEQTADSPIRFHNLSSLLQPPLGCRRQDDQRPAVFHPVSTNINDRDDECRAILLETCRSSAKDLRFVIQTNPDHSLTSLYRGFSRFMCEDLKATTNMCGLSNKQRVKLSNKVALEMIQRNQAYSHLVELAMPKHVRLSIHAHNNSGPKFAVRLLPPPKFHACTGFGRGFEQRADVNSTDIVAYEAKNHLHIPTP